MPLLEKLAVQWECGECHLVFSDGVATRIVNVLGLIVRNVDEKGKLFRLVEVNRVFASGNIQNRQLDVSLVARNPAPWNDVAITEIAMYSELSVRPQNYTISVPVPPQEKIKIVQKESQTFPGIPTVYYMRILYVDLHENVEIIPARTNPKSTLEWVPIR
jgi:hypothetical protein